MSKVIDLTGRRFGRLTVVARDGNETGSGGVGQAAWRVRCDCDPGGNRLFRATGSNLRRGRTKSCGCLRAEQIGTRSTTHGFTRGLPYSGTGCRAGQITPEYNVWSQAKARCHNPKSVAFQRYGARGIAMCRRWRDDFAAFLTDMGPRPSLEHTCDRIDNARGYECGRAECADCGPAGRTPNCRWADRVGQARNKTNNRTLTLNGETLCVAEWAERLGMRPMVIHERLARGWSDERALTERVRSAMPQPSAPSLLPQNSSDFYSSSALW